MDCVCEKKIYSERNMIPEDDKDYEDIFCNSSYHCNRIFYAISKVGFLFCDCDLLGGIGFRVIRFA